MYLFGIKILSLLEHGKLPSVLPYTATVYLDFGYLADTQR